ncbi:MAG: cobalamin biosynthesis protein, partial [Deltaproteobacteria bacterium]|nr:cobalamin biosynthesis protein [Deltaproteobacteria bacterium]
VGIGCGKGVGREDIARAYFALLKEKNISPLCVRNLATSDIKKHEKGLIEFSERLGLPLESISKKRLLRFGPKRPSGFVMEKTGLPGVAVPAALASSGAKKLWTKKTRVGKITLALAKGYPTQKARSI